MLSLRMAALFLLLALLPQNPDSCASLEAEGRALLRFKAGVEADPYGALLNWEDGGCGELEQCSWFGVECSDDGRVTALNLKDLCLKGTLMPELGKLIHLKSLILSNNSFYGTIPEEIGGLQKLQVLDLRNNNLSGLLPSNLGRILSLEFLNVSNATITRRILQVVINLKDIPRKNPPSPAPSPLVSPSHQSVDPPSSKVSHVPNVSFSFRSSETPAPKFSPSSSPSNVSPVPPPRSDDQQSNPPMTVPSPSEGISTRKKHSTSWTIYTTVGGGISFLIALSAIYMFCCRANKVVTVMPWATGLSGQLQKALVTGVPSLKRSELERACEDFSNVIGSLSDCMLYKGTLSSGVEIAVTSTMITSAKDWSPSFEALFMNKISLLSKVNHKNFMNLLGYSKEEEPFARMMVFEYAPNGTLFEHLHIREAEHIDWAARLRIAMGIAYCLEHMHQLNPPVVLSNLNSSSIYLSNDFAAKVSDLVFLKYDEAESGPADETLGPESIVYKFGIILLELISGRRPFSEDDGLLVLWASSYLTGQRPLRDMVDSTLESFREEDVGALCEVIRPCISPYPREKPTMAEVVEGLRKITGMAPDEATPKLSPLWWAELEIISVDTS